MIAVPLTRLDLILRLAKTAVLVVGVLLAGCSDQSSKEGSFSLLYRDDFDALDFTRWQVMTHSWDTNLALFSGESVAVRDGSLELSLLKAPDGTMDSGGTAKPFFGAEVRSRDTLTYGRVRTRARFARGPAVISSLVTIYTPWPADNWNELDIESLGAKPESLQFNAQVYLGTLPAPTKPVSPSPDEAVQALGFDASADYHVYQIEWTPREARFSIDDQVARTWTRHIDLMNLPQNVLLTIWASSVASWAGAVNDDTVKAKASYDWVELYEYAR
ncbi:MAG TPA: glycoside hydrolase family 16 protein [Polyangiaceae bacterium]|nr:glycoside hydrolase family 16 protein [Polyangiaceae bacterium]